MDTRVRRSRSDESSIPLLSTTFRISKHIRVILDIELAEVGVGVGPDHFLAVLEPGRSDTVGSLAKALSVRASTVSKMVTHMTASGLLERRTGAADLRKSMIALTPLGERVRDQVLGVWSALDADIRVSLDDVDEVERQVRAIDERLSAYVSRLR